MLSVGSQILLGCSSGFGEGGLGSHLRFLYQASDSAGKSAGVFCRQAPAKQGFVTIPFPKWGRWVKFSPVRWLPSVQVYWMGRQFDEMVSESLPRHPVVYHSFPGFAEKSFRKVKERGGITVLEAATTHAEDVYEITEAEHRKYRIGGNHFSRVWVDRVLREYELSDYISVASKLQLETFVKRGFPRERILFTPLGIDTKRFSPGQKDETIKPSIGQNEPFRIIQVGQVSLRKGFPYLLEAVKQLDDPDIEIILYGGVGWRSIRALIEEYQQAGLKIQLGAGDPVPAMRNAHLCIHSSIEDGFGLAPLEAMAVGLPTVVTEMTGMKDAVTNGVNGFVVPSKDSKAIARCITELKGNETYRLEMARAARNSALQYDLEKMVLQYAETLQPVWTAI